MQHKPVTNKSVATLLMLLGFSLCLLANGADLSPSRPDRRMLRIDYSLLDSSLPAGKAGLKKYVYAEMMYQVQYSIPKFMLYRKTISADLKKAVNAALYRDEALDLLGDDGWELVSVITRIFDAGFELFFYFKKPRD